PTLPSPPRDPADPPSPHHRTCALSAPSPPSPPPRCHPRESGGPSGDAATAARCRRKHLRMGSRFRGNDNEYGVAPRQHAGTRGPPNLSPLSPPPPPVPTMHPSLPRGAACSDQWRKDGRAGGGRSFPGLAGWSAQVRRGAVSPAPHARNGVVAPRSKIPASRGDVVSLINTQRRHRLGAPLRSQPTAKSRRTKALVQKSAAMPLISQSP